MVRPITKGMIKTTKNDNGEWREWTFRFTQLSFDRSCMSKKQRQIHSEMKENGFDLYMIDEYNIRQVWDDKGYRWVPFPSSVAMMEIKGDGYLYAENCVVIFRKAMLRAIRQAKYNQELAKDPVRLERWVRRHKHDLKDDEVSVVLNTSMPNLSEIMVHELAHIICHNRNLADNKKAENIRKQMLQEYHVNKETELLYVLREKISILQHGRDFKRVYRSLCKKYNVKEELNI